MTERRKDRNTERREETQDPVVSEPMRLESSEEHFRGKSDGEILQHLEL